MFSVAWRTYQCELKGNYTLVVCGVRMNWGASQSLSVARSVLALVARPNQPGAATVRVSVSVLETHGVWRDFDVARLAALLQDTLWYACLCVCVHHPFPSFSVVRPTLFRIFCWNWSEMGSSLKIAKITNKNILRGLMQTLRVLHRLFSYITLLCIGKSKKKKKNGLSCRGQLNLYNEGGKKRKRERCSRMVWEKADTHP